MRPRRRSHWAVEADKVLATLFVNSQEPTRAELRDAYPSRAPSHHQSACETPVSFLSVFDVFLNVLTVFWPVLIEYRTRLQIRNCAAQIRPDPKSLFRDCIRSHQPRSPGE